MKLENSPLTTNFLKDVESKYSKIGLFWGSLVLLTSCYVANNSKWLLMKFGSSGAGKTITDKIALETYGERLNPLYITGRLTPAGLVKLVKLARRSYRILTQLEKFRSTGLIFVEDLSRCTTHYLKLTSLQFLAGLTRNTSFDDLTSDGGIIGLDLGDEPKKAMLAGTPSDWEEIASTSIYNEFVDRRSLTVISLMSPEEWENREKRAIHSLLLKTDEEIIKEWKNLLVKQEVKPYFGKIELRVFPQDRLRLYRKLSRFKKYPENLFQMIDSLAEGHARINGRDRVLAEDYEILNKIFSRYLVLSDMRKKELFIAEEVIRSPNGCLSIEDLIYRLRVRAKEEEIPSLAKTSSTINDYLSFSKYLTLNTKNGQVFISLSPYLRNIFQSWNKEMEEILTC